MDSKERKESEAASDGRVKRAITEILVIRWVNEKNLFSNRDAYK